MDDRSYLTIGLSLGMFAFAPAHGYQAVQTVRIAGASIQVLEDARLTPALSKLLWQGAVDPVLALGEDNPAAEPFKQKPLVPARLRTVGPTGATIVEVVPDEQAPLARIERQRLGDDARPVILITTDNAAGFGSYSGYATGLYRISGGRLTHIRAAADDGGWEPVSVVSTLKSGWKIVDRAPNHTVIEQVLCRPDLARPSNNQEPKFLLTYVTYWSDGRHWRVKRRETSGFWESDDGWPPRSDFPKPDG